VSVVRAQVLRRLPQRGVALGAIILVHAGVIAALAVAQRSRRPERTQDFVSTAIFLTSATRPPPTPNMPASPALAVKPTTITMPMPDLPGPQGGVDWADAAHVAATQVTAASQARAFGHNPASDAVAARAGPEHHAGEQYVEADGSRVVWVSDRCYVTSSPPPLGTADVIARAIPTRTVCKGDPGWSRGDLFKDLHGPPPGEPRLP
jgi:hypothetical protein